MEGLVIIFAEAIVALVEILVALVPLLVTGLSAMASLIALAIEAVFAFGLELFNRRARRLNAVPASAPVPRSRPRIRRWLWISALIVCGLAGFGAMAIHWSGDRLVRWALDRVAQRGGPQITAERIKANLWAGDIRLSNATCTWADRHELRLQARSVHLDIDLWDLFWGERHLEHLEIDGVRGAISTRLGLPTQRSGAAKPARIDHLLIQDVDLATEFRLGASDVGGQLVIARAHVDDLNTRTLAFDLFFRANLAGSWDGLPFVISSQDTTGGRLTTWAIERLPVAIFAAWLGNPWTILRSGTVDVQVNDSWSLNEPRIVELDYCLRFHELTVAAPDDAGPLLRTIATTLATVAAAKGGELELAFDFSVDPDRFVGHWSDDLGNLGTLASEALLEQYVPDPKNRERAKAAAGAAAGWARDTLDRWRKGEDKPAQAP